MNERSRTEECGFKTFTPVVPSDVRGESYVLPGSE